MSIADGPAQAGTHRQPLAIGRAGKVKTPPTRIGDTSTAISCVSRQPGQTAIPERPGCNLAPTIGNRQAVSLHTSSETGDASRKSGARAKTKSLDPPAPSAPAPPPRPADEGEDLASPGFSDADHDDESVDERVPPPARMTVDKSRRDRNYLGKARLYVEQEPYRIRTFAADAIAQAEARGRRLHNAMRAQVRPSSPRPTLLDVESVLPPTCFICEANPALLVVIPCDHCCMCSECAARHRIMSVASAATERHAAERSLLQADQLERAAKTRADALRMAISSGRADLALSPGAQEAIEADMREARSRRAAARYVKFVRPRTACPVCNFRIDAVLSLSRVAQLHRSYGGANLLTEEFKESFLRRPPVPRPALRGRTAADATATATATATGRQYHPPTPTSEDPRDDLAPDHHD